MKINVSEEIRAVCPAFVGAAVSITLTNTPYSTALWEEINRELDDYRLRYTTDSIKEMPAIPAASTRLWAKTQAAIAPAVRHWCDARCRAKASTR